MPALRMAAGAMLLTALGSISSAMAQESTVDRPAETATTDQNNRAESNKLEASNQPGTPIVEALARKLQQANKAEIELAKLAVEKSEQQEIKQLAQTIISDHSQLNKQLEQFAEGNSARQSSPAELRSNRTAQRSAGANDSALVPQELCKLMEKACDNSLQMTKQMLQKYDGQDFAMAYLGQQIVAHTAMLAELQAIESSGFQSLHSIAKTGIKKTEDHLQTAKQLAKKFEDKERLKK